MTRTASTVAWLALVISIVALVLAWMTYNRTGEDLENQIQRQVNKAVQQIDEGSDNVDEDTTDQDAQQ